MLTPCNIQNIIVNIVKYSQWEQIYNLTQYYISLVYRQVYQKIFLIRHNERTLHLLTGFRF